jgi:Cof subfamily protein (haloacid dehalogenase superfamily)
MKWWFSDYDGTINVHHNDQFDVEDLEFINEWIAKGNKLVIASGRMNHEIKEVLVKNNIPFDYLVTNNGACVYDADDNMISHLTIPANKRVDILKILNSFKGKLKMAYCLENERIDLGTAEVSEVDTNNFLSMYAPKTDNWERGEIDVLTSDKLNLIYFYLNKEDIPAVKKAFEKVDGVKVVKTVANVLEVMNEKVSKAYGIDVLKELKNFDIDDVVTSGDGENDIEMLDHTKFSFAMKTADAYVQEHGKYQIDHVREIKNIIKY